MLLSKLIYGLFMVVQFLAPLDVKPKDVKGKGKEKAATPSFRIDSQTDDTLWVDIHAPQSEEDLAVHKKKINDVRNWLLEARDGGANGTLKKYRRILVLTGPAGVGKTATVRVLAKQCGFAISEWRNASEEFYEGMDIDWESVSQKFDAFLNRALYQSVLVRSEPSNGSSSSQSGPSKQIVLVEDMPNILHPGTQSAFHASLVAFLDSPPVTPLIIIVSDSGLRGESREGPPWHKEVFDVRTILPPALLQSPYITQISFNPIASTLMRKALQKIVQAEVSSGGSQMPSKEDMDMMIESSNGDIRSALMALQFASVINKGSKEPVKKRTRKGKNLTVAIEAITRREQSLALFHLLGKILYNKRKGDPPNASSSQKDREKEAEAWAQIKDPTPLPDYLAGHNRAASKVDIEKIYADASVDSSLFSLYLHQNYVQFCDNVDQCGDVSEWLSCVDASGEHWWQHANPYRFHLVSLGVLHSLPSPVTRRSQKLYKPEFFDELKKSRECETAMVDLRDWLDRESLGENSDPDGIPRRVGGWTRDAVVTELGGLLNARLSLEGMSYMTLSPGKAELMELPMIGRGAPFATQWLRMPFSWTAGTGGAHGREIEDDGDIAVPHIPSAEEMLFTRRTAAKEKDDDEGGWLEGDDIDEY
ncbi:Rad17-domain-containing protein [Sistotremastrum niveocremeum HHB9708]|uniref:Rad17-domain-containing protein n=1 Tax=Sistotremastrum niveocremeum HHB9708 TaxID=1314777 RepID=A0A164PWX6_9AGAM|nr:Rad17-domain-containing protein [Sistotremastrum niveocremeum HHB9708]